MIRSTTWYNTGRPVRLAGIDGRAMFFFVLLLYHVTWWTFGLACSVVIFLVALERRGYSVPNALRRLRTVLIGRHRPAVSGRRRGRSDR